MSYEAGLAIISVGVMWFFSLLMINIDDEEHVILKFFLMLISVWFVPVVWNIGTQMAIANSAAAGVLNAMTTGYRVIIVSSFVITAYLILYYVKSVFVIWIDLVRNKREGKE